MDRWELFLRALNSHKFLSLVKNVVMQAELTLHTKRLLSRYIAVKLGEWDLRCVVATFTKLFQPKRFLEIGTFRGITTCCAVVANPNIDILSYDIWMNPYFVDPNYPILNPGPVLINKELKKFGFNGTIEYKGNSLNLSTQKPEGEFGLVLVDGAHDSKSATRDLNNTVGLLALHGLIIFDDIKHHDHQALAQVWNNFKEQHKDDFIFVENWFAMGTGIGWRIKQ